MIFKSHLSYCISSWGSIPSSKLQSLFSIQKRCIRLLFGTEYSYDHSGYYETCARARSYEEHIAKKNFCLEHTKPLFNKQKILSLGDCRRNSSFGSLLTFCFTHISEKAAINLLLRYIPTYLHYLCTRTF